MPLVFAKSGNNLKILKIAADQKTKSHLESLGVMAGTLITAVSNTGGNMIILVRGGRLALDKSLAAKILVA